jgi:hypothetical protein
MGKIYFIILLFSYSLYAEDSFITNDEYAKLLYKNPRGIGCNKCHGEKGEGMVISSFEKAGSLYTLRGPQINNISIKRFKKALKKAKGLMPEYFLTDMEKAYLYYYLTIQNEKGVKVAKQEHSKK